MTATQPGWVASAKHPQQSGPERLLTQFEKDIMVSMITLAFDMK
jgi:hypothetical protein